MVIHLQVHASENKTGWGKRGFFLLLLCVYMVRIILGMSTHNSQNIPVPNCQSAKAAREAMNSNQGHMMMSFNDVMCNSGGIQASGTTWMKWGDICNH